MYIHCMYIYMYMYIFKCIYLYIQIYIYTHIHAHIHVYICIYIYKFLYVHIYTFMYLYTYIAKETILNIYIHIHIRVNIYISQEINTHQMRHLPLKIPIKTGLFCKSTPHKQGSFTKEPFFAGLCCKRAFILWASLLIKSGIYRKRAASLNFCPYTPLPSPSPPSRRRVGVLPHPP